MEASVRSLRRIYQQARSYFETKPEVVYQQSVFFAPRTRTYWCSDCDAVGEQSTYCPKCGSSALLNLGRVLRDYGDSIRLLT
jgi:Zn finger protein HypA/HybF involved in hydrogenase expression